MKICAVLLLAFLCLPAFAEDANKKQGKADVRSMTGPAKYTKGGGVQLPLKVGTILRSGSTVTTSPESTIDFYLAVNGPVVRLTPSSTLTFTELTQQAPVNKGEPGMVTTRLKVESGKMLAHVRPRTPGSVYEVQAGSFTFRIVGTDFAISADGNLTVATGKVTFTSGEKEVELAAGQTWDATLQKPRPATPPELKELKSIQ